jgi:hypothetical protein
LRFRTCAMPCIRAAFVSPCLVKPAHISSSANHASCIARRHAVGVASLRAESGYLDSLSPKPVTPKYSATSPSPPPESSNPSPQNVEPRPRVSLVGQFRQFGRTVLLTIIFSIALLGVDVLLALTALTIGSVVACAELFGISTGSQTAVAFANRILRIGLVAARRRSRSMRRMLRETMRDD